jgi:nucleotide-binding universal stress UspA family protein
MQFQNIVFPVDFSDRSRTAAPFIQSMARRYDAVVRLIHSVPALPALYFDVGTAYSEAFDPEPVVASLKERLCGFAAEQFPHLQTECLVIEKEPARAIVDWACELDACLIALPTHGYGVFRRALLGSVTSRVLHDSPVPVWTSAHCCEASHRAHPQPRVIVAAIDHDDDKGHTVYSALSIARDTGARVELLEAASTRLKHFATAAVPAVGGVLLQDPEEEILPVEHIEARVRRVALRERADLVVVNRASAHAYAVIRESPCPVLSV